MSAPRRRPALAARAVAAALALVIAGCGTAPSPSRSPDGTATPAATASSIPSPQPLACDAPAHETHWWNERVFYEVFVRSFADSDGDGIGDLRGATARLDYLNDGDPGNSSNVVAFVRSPGLLAGRTGLSRVHPGVGRRQAASWDCSVVDS
jgi:alpha-amylase